jgi:hypothetical protein
MPVFKKSNVIFIHIPKTGGTSIERQLYEFEDPTDRYSVASYFSTDINSQKLRNYSLQHYTFQDFIFVMGDSKLNTYKTIFSVVRNPYDRIVSEFHYYYSVVKKAPVDDCTVDELKCKFEKFCLKCFEGQLYNDNHHAPQYKFIVNSGIEIDKRIHVLKFESLTKDFTKVFNMPLKYHELRSNRKLSCYEYYTDKSQKLVADFYKFDFILFDYDAKVLPNDL